MRLTSLCLVLAACGGSVSPFEAPEAPLPDDGQVPPPAGTSCRDILIRNPGSASGVYSIQPSPAYPAANVFCDMVTDGGGWTMVSSSDTPPTDRAVGYNRNIATVNPRSLMDGIWVGMNPAITTGLSDIRFVCRPPGAAPAVDLSFYANGWYSELTSSQDEALVCFEEENGIGQTRPPARRNNRNGDFRAAGNQWDFGYFEGEDFCNTPDDFTVDFDDRGMDSNQTDGTDWGRDDGSLKCGTGGTLGRGQANWYILVRESDAVPTDTAVDTSVP